MALKCYLLTPRHDLQVPGYLLAEERLLALARGVSGCGMVRDGLGLPLRTAELAGSLCA